MVVLIMPRSTYGGASCSSHGSPGLRGSTLRPSDAVRLLSLWLLALILLLALLLMLLIMIMTVMVLLLMSLLLLVVLVVVLLLLLLLVVLLVVLLLLLTLMLLPRQRLRLRLHVLRWHLRERRTSTALLRIVLAPASLHTTRVTRTRPLTAK